MGSLSSKLRALGVQVGTQNIPQPQRIPGFGLDDILPGKRKPTVFGEAYYVEEVYPPGYQHGSTGFEISASLQVMAEWGRAAQLAETDPTRFYFLDTETTGLSGGTGTYAFLVGVGHFTPAGFELVQFMMRDPSEESALLAALDEYLHPCHALVTYNGKAFDAPLLNTRYTLQGIQSPLLALPNFDLLPLARRIWRDRLPSRALSYLEAAVLGTARTRDEVPGWMIPQIYFNYLRSGDARPLKGVLYHNAMDVLSLAALFSYTVRLLANPLELDDLDPVDLVAIARLMDELGYQDASVAIFRRGLEKGLPETNFWETLERLARIYRRQRDWENAVSLWKQAAQHGQVYACVELAKYYEHECRTCTVALEWTREAIVRVDAPDFPLYLRKQTLSELQRRQERLERKVQKEIAN